MEFEFIQPKSKSELCFRLMTAFGICAYSGSQRPLENPMVDSKKGTAIVSYLDDSNARVLVATDAMDLSADMMDWYVQQCVSLWPSKYINALRCRTDPKLHYEVTDIMMVLTASRMDKALAVLETTEYKNYLKESNHVA